MSQESLNVLMTNFAMVVVGVALPVLVFMLIVWTRRRLPVHESRQQPNIAQRQAAVHSLPHDDSRGQTTAGAGARESATGANSNQVSAPQDVGLPVVVRDGTVVWLGEVPVRQVLQRDPSLTFRAVLLAIESGVPLGRELTRAIRDLEGIHSASNATSVGSDSVLAILRHPSWIGGLQLLEHLRLLQVYLPDAGAMRSAGAELPSGSSHPNPWQATVAMATKLPQEADLPTRLAVLFSLTASVLREEGSPGHARRSSRKGVFYKSRKVAEEALERLQCLPMERARVLALMRIMPTLRFIAEDKEPMSVYMVIADFGPEAEQIQRALWIVDAMAEIGQCPQTDVVKSKLLEAKRLAENEPT